MSNFCASGLPAGADGCLKDLASIKGIIIADESVSFASPSSFLSKEAWRVYIQESLLAAPFIVTTAEDTTDDPNVETSGRGLKSVSSNPPPSLLAYANSNYCDYASMVKNYDGGTYQAFFMLEDGSIMGQIVPESGVIKGFSCNVTARGKMLPQTENKQQAFRLYVNFEDAEEFTSGLVRSVVWDVKDLVDYMPTGTGLYITTAYAASDVVVQLNERCGTGLTGQTDVADWEILETNDLDTPVISAVAEDAAITGRYKITLEKGAAPAALAAGDWAVIRNKGLSTLVVEYVSDKLIVQA